MKLTDEEWVAQARRRVAHGESWDAGSALDLMALGNEPRQPKQPALLCPFCEPHPPLEEVRPFESTTVTPLMRCRSCCGLWAAGDALTSGVRVTTDDDPAFFAVPAPARCRACGGWLRDNETCVKCHKSLPRLNCPRCGKEMQRARQQGVTLDTCEACDGAWFDVGEIGQVFGLKPTASLAASYVEQQHGMEEDPPPAWALALDILLRVFVPFLR